MGSVAIQIITISIHAAQVGSDYLQSPFANCRKKFQSTLPKWAATAGERMAQGIFVFQSTLPKWAATLSLLAVFDFLILFQSTLPKWAATCRLLLQIHRAELFQSTLPKWAATVQDRLYRGYENNFNPRCPSGQRRDFRKGDIVHLKISIHAAQVGSDWQLLFIAAAVRVFQSTLPKWAATYRIRNTNGQSQHFNPRCPSGQRLTIKADIAPDKEISIHAAQVGSDCTGQLCY